MILWISRYAVDVAVGCARRKHKTADTTQAYNSCQVKFENTHTLGIAAYIDVKSIQLMTAASK